MCSLERSVKGDRISIMNSFLHPDLGVRSKLQNFLVPLLVNSKEPEKKTEERTKARNELLSPWPALTSFLWVKKWMCFQALPWCSFLFQRSAAGLPFKCFITTMVFTPFPSPLASHKAWWGVLVLGECLLFRLLPLLRSHVCPLRIAAGQTSWSEHSEICPRSPNPEDSIRWVLLHRPSPSHLQHFQHLQIYQQSICPEGAQGDVACSLEKSARAQTPR